MSVRSPAFCRDRGWRYITRPRPMCCRSARRCAGSSLPAACASRSCVPVRCRRNFSRGPQAAAPSSATSLLPVLIVLHQETSTPGRVGNVLRALGHRLDIRRPRFGDPLPETLDGHAGAVIFGGPMSVNDPDDFIRREIAWIAVPLREQRPFLGICLGAQMLAMQLGARVAPHPQVRSQIGYYPGRPTPAGLEISPNWPDHVYHWHQKGFELPPGSQLLAEGDGF